MTGRPSSYTPELAAEICERLSEGEPLRKICRDDHMPYWRTVYNWKAKDEALSTAIAHARDLGHDALAEEALDIADNTDEDPASRRVRVETRLKLLAKWNPKRYGEKMALTGGDPDAGDKPLQISWLPTEG